MKLLTHIPSFLRNKYVVAIAVFVAVILFFDKNDLFTQVSRTQQLHDLEESKEYYTKRIETEQKELNQLKTNAGTLEKYAREKYMMKRDNEDLFIIPENTSKEN